jgi:hypothetical protein
MCGTSKWFFLSHLLVIDVEFVFQTINVQISFEFSNNLGLVFDKSLSLSYFVAVQLVQDLYKSMHH